MRICACWQPFEYNIMNETEYRGILHKEVNKLSNINPRFHRISSMLLDHIIMTIVIVPPLILTMILMISGIVKFNNQFWNIGFLTMFFIYLNKDFFKAKSPAKRILGYQVINRANGNPATELQCFVRNLTLLYCLAFRGCCRICKSRKANRRFYCKY